jgi:hypothetical protein
MRYVLLYWAGIVAGLCSDPRGDSWASVPASRLASRIDSFVVARAPDENVVAIVGMRPKENTAPPRSTSVVGFGLDLPLQEKGRSDPPKEGSAVVPAESVWPGPDGRIAVQPLDTAGAGKGSGLRNPWEIRMRPAPELRVFVFANGGVIAGGSGGPVALLNGRIVRRGAVADGFEVALVTSAAVVLRRSGISYAIPLARRTSIEMAVN